MSTECQLSVEEQSGEVSRQAREGHKGELINRELWGLSLRGWGRAIGSPLLSPEMDGGIQASLKGVNKSRLII